MDSADHIVTGAWGQKAVKEASRFGELTIVFDERRTAFGACPLRMSFSFDPNATYIHYTSNETIDGVEFKYDLDGHGIPVVCDASSNILSKPIDIEKYALDFAGAQKNIGPSGLTWSSFATIMLDRAPRELPRSTHLQSDRRKQTRCLIRQTRGEFISSASFATGLKNRVACRDGDTEP